MTEFLVTSNLAEVKLLFLPSSSSNGEAGKEASSVSSSSVEPDDLLLIEAGDQRHTTVASSKVSGWLTRVRCGGDKRIGNGRREKEILGVGWTVSLAARNTGGLGEGKD